MADFDPPFADQGERRVPLSTEQQLGWPCGPASRELFNYLFWLQQGQIRSIADEAGVASEQSGDHTVLKRAVLALIEAAIATLDPPEDPDLSAFVTINQARSRLPIFPDVLHGDGHLGVFSPSTGVVRVPAGRNFLHRGIALVTTSEVNLNTDASKIYHLRWNPADGFVLRDLASGTYNPGTLSEDNPVFDTAHDDMLVARVVTNSSNAATVTNLLNKSVLRFSEGIAAVNFQQPGTNASRGDIIADLNWARTPKLKSFSRTYLSTGTSRQSDWDEFMYQLGGYPGSPPIMEIPANRYRIAYTMIYDFSVQFSHQVNAEA